MTSSSRILTYNWGIKRNIPIVRLGSIAAMPEDPVDLETGPDIVTLVEVHSIGGLSGAPVFVHLSVLRDAPEGKFLVGGGAKASSVDRVLDLIHRPDQIATRGELRKRVEGGEGVVPIAT